MAKQILKQSVGLDVSKDTIAACFSQQEIGNQFKILSSKTFTSSASGFRQMHGWISHFHQQGIPLHLLMEATGVYYEEAAYFLFGKGIRVTVLLPNKTNAFAKSLEYKSKTDKIDAKKLAQMSLERNLPKWEPCSAKMLTIKRLCRERAEVLDAKNVAENRLHAKKYSHEPEKSSLKRSLQLIKFYKNQVKEIEAAIEAAIAADPQIKERMDKACTIPGVAMITAATVVSEANGFTLFKNKAQLVSYAGYDIVQNQSGTSIQSPTKISKKGNYRIRKALHFPALVAIKYVPELKDIYLRIFDRTKIKMKASVAVQRKLLVLIYTLYKDNQTFDPAFKSVKKPDGFA